MILETIKGDIFHPFEDGIYAALVHGCNCFHTMGGGIARSVRLLYPEAYDSDLQTVKGDVTKLGSYSEFDTGHGIIINGYTQFMYGGIDRKHVDYDAIRSVFKQLNTRFKDQIICIPMIGAGLAGGDWEVISSIINEETPDVAVHLYVFDG